MAKSKYVQCRLEESTHRRLTAFLEELRAKATAKPQRYPPGLLGGKVGLTDAIDYLLLYWDNEQARKTSYTAMKKAKAKEEDEILYNILDNQMIAEGCPNV